MESGRSAFSVCMCMCMCVCVCVCVCVEGGICLGTSLDKVVNKQPNNLLRGGDLGKIRFIWQKSANPSPIRTFVPVGISYEKKSYDHGFGPWLAGQLVALRHDVVSSTYLFTY